jgi:hypothetical protein
MKNIKVSISTASSEKLAPATSTRQDVARNMNKLCKEWKNDVSGISYSISKDKNLSGALLYLVENLDFIEDEDGDED